MYDEPVNKSIEMLTIKECSEVVTGVSQHTIRILVKENKMPHLRAGRSKCGKILIKKSDLLDYFTKI